MPDYMTLKVLHQTTVALSICGFLWRGGLMLSGSTLRHRRWMRSWPHLIDTALLASGVTMAVQLQLNPLNHAWLAAKIAALLLYIGLGFIALRLGSTYRIRLLAFLLAVVCFAYIALVAINKSALPL